MLTLLWAGNVHGFSDDVLTVKLVIYLSKQWLWGIHIDQQLDLLQCDLVHSAGDAKCEIMDTTFSQNFARCFGIDCRSCIMQVYLEHVSCGVLERNLLLVSKPKSVVRGISTTITGLVMLRLTLPSPNSSMVIHSGMIQLLK